jgi:uncharacterized protein with PQ loop repeat
MFKLPTLIKLPKHREFTYIPRYYDPDVEEIKERLAEKQALRQIHNKESQEERELDVKTRMIKAFSQSRRDRQLYKTTDKKAILVRVFIMFFLIIGFFTWLFAGETITNFLILGDNKVTIPIVIGLIIFAIFIKNMLTLKRKL